MDTVCPNVYSCSPHAPTAFMMDALCTTRVATPAARARSSRSVCVVAPKGSPTTRKDTARPASAGARMVSASDSTVSRCASSTGLPSAADSASVPTPRMDV